MSRCLVCQKKRGKVIKRADNLSKLKVNDVSCI